MIPHLAIRDVLLCYDNVSDKKACIIRIVSHKKPKKLFFRLFHCVFFRQKQQDLIFYKIKYIILNMELEQIVSTNLTALRKKREWTQAELAEKINYSDKSVSKWERGEALPDLKVLTKLAELFGVTVDYFVTENAEETPEQFTSPGVRRRYQYWIISLAVTLVWLIATTVFVYIAVESNLAGGANIWAWTCFVWALPASFLVLLVFDYRYFHSRLFVYFASLLMWTLIAAIFLQWLNHAMWMLFLLGIPAQAIITLTDLVRRTKNRK